jgi:hypothetical protein
MATIDLITYDQKMVTPKDDALIHQFGISNGVLYGCDVTLADSNTLHITGGQGVIYGRQWEITEGDITVTLPASGSLKGRLYVKIDLSNTTNPIELLVQTDVTLPDLTDDDQINVNNSVSELELYTFDVSSLTISNLVKTVETVADGDHADVVQMQNDISQLNSRLNVIGGGYSLESKGVTSIPSNTDTVIYGKVLPQGKYILSAKIYCNVSNASCYLMCGGIRQQLTCTNVAYMTVCGLVTSNGSTETQLHFYQNSGTTQTRTDNFDDVYLVRIL